MFDATDGNLASLRRYEDEQDKLEEAYEAYQLKCSDEATPILTELTPIVDVYETITALGRTDDETKAYTYYLEMEIADLYAEIYAIFNDGDYEVRPELKEFVGSIYSVCESL